MHALQVAFMLAAMKRQLLLAIVGCGALWMEAVAQREPRIGYIYPAGGRQGTTFTATLGGTALEGVTHVYFSGAGVTATVLKIERQPTPMEQDALVKELSQLRGKRERGERLTSAEAQRAATIRYTLDHFGRQLSNQALNQFATVRVSIATKATLGKHEIRLDTTLGLSNPLTFCVDDLPEISKPDWKNVPKSKDSMEAELTTSTNGIPITLPVIVNGQIQPGGVDRYRFTAKQGQRLTVLVSARELLPYLADAVPGWLQATLALYDAQGAELAYDDNYLFRPDPVLMFKIPCDGEYTIAIKDALFRGREDFVYRVAIGELPFITDLYPLGAQAGTQCSLAVNGWNLPQRWATLDLRGRAAGLLPFAVRSGRRDSNRVPFAVDTLSEFFEHEPNNTLTNANAVTLPLILNGRMDQPGDADVFRFDGHAGQQIAAEVMARRLNSALDSQLKLSDAAGNLIAFNDDHEDKGSGLDTHHADSFIMATLPSNGVYFVRIGDTQRTGGTNFSYRLRISAPRPDFALRITPSSLNVRGGTSVPLSVYALRRDGFGGEITLSLKGAPAGFALAAATVPAGQDKVKVTLAVPPTASPEQFSLQIEGHAKIQGKDVARPAVPADDLTQAFAYRHLVPAQELKVAVWGGGAARGTGRITSATPIRIPADSTARIEISLHADERMGKVEFDLADAPEGLAITSVTPGANTTTLVVQADGEKIKPGVRGNLVIRAFAEYGPQSAGKATAQNKRRIPLGALPAVPFEITAPNLK